jgi:hypothetical protein
MLMDKTAESPARKKVEAVMAQVRKTGEQLRQKITLPWGSAPAKETAATNSAPAGTAPANPATSAP